MNFRYTMNRIFVGIVSLLATAVMAVSCIEEPTISFNDIEQRSLKAWIEKHRPELKDNYQEEGGYYVEVLDAGCADSLAITGKMCVCGTTSLAVTLRVPSARHATGR